MMDYTADLEEPQVFTIKSSGLTVMAGFIFNDKRKRFTDGTLVRTSPLVGDPVKKGAYLYYKTLNSVYRTKDINAGS